MRTPDCPPRSRFGEQIVLNAHCIDFVYGGVYAWAYLAMAGVAEPDILVILRTPYDSWGSATPSIAAVAQRAMHAMGMHRPVEAYTMAMTD